MRQHEGSQGKKWGLTQCYSCLYSLIHCQICLLKEVVQTLKSISMDDTKWSRKKIISFTNEGVNQDRWKTLLMVVMSRYYGLAAGVHENTLTPKSITTKVRHVQDQNNMSIEPTSLLSFYNKVLQFFRPKTFYFRHLFERENVR